MNEKLYSVYMVTCADNSVYIGISNNVTARVAAHNKGRGAKYTKYRRPVVLLGTDNGEHTLSEALKLEYQLKQLSRKNKLLWILAFIPK